MSDEQVALAAAIGARVRKGRKARGWTLEQLAEAAGASRRSVINVEHGVANPSVGILLKISDALGIGLPSLVAPALRGRELTVTRSGTAPVLWRGEHGGSGQLVAGTRPPDVLELWVWKMEPGDRHRSEAHTPGTQEAIHILAGTVTVQVGEQEIELRCGDAMPFPGDVDHAYTNNGTESARFSLTVFEPSVGDDPSQGASRDPSSDGAR